MNLAWLTWSSPVARWWMLLTFVSAANVTAWFVLYRRYHELPTGPLNSNSVMVLMLLLSAAYVFGCAFRSCLPRADVQRICLFDTFLSSVLIGRSVATVAEVSFAVQWAIILNHLGQMTGTNVALTVSFVIVPLIVIAQCLSWYAVLTTNSLGNAIENSIWAVAFFLVGAGLCALLGQFEGLVRLVLAVAIVGIAGYLVFLMTIDVPMYLSRWQAGLADGKEHLRPLEGLRDVSTRWVV